MYPLLQMPKELHQYKQGTTFGQVMTLYRFDKKLRLFIFNEIEKIEVAVRSAIVNTGSEMTGNPFWMTDEVNFTNHTKFVHTMTLIDAEISRSREDFIVHFKQAYSDPYPPAWILAEVLPFGVMTNIYSNIKLPRLKKGIAQKFGLQVAPFESWLTIVTLTQLLLSPCTCMEQAEHHPPDATQPYERSLANTAHRPFTYILQYQYYQVLP